MLPYPPNIGTAERALLGLWLSRQVERLPSGKLEVLLDEHVVPPAPVTDYKTPVSGVEEHHLEAATLTLADVQDHLMRVVATQDVLVGHNLSSDLKVPPLVFVFHTDTVQLLRQKCSSSTTHNTGHAFRHLPTIPTKLSV